MADGSGDAGGAGTAAAPIYQVLGAPPVLDDGTMEDIIVKLRLLNYEQDFCKTQATLFKPLTKTYFAAPSDNVNLQLFYFTSLCSWLMTASGYRDFPPPGQFDDPNATATNILIGLRAMELPVRDIAPTRLRTGNGEAVLIVLSLLVDKALIAKGFAFRPVEYPVDKSVVEERDSIDLRSGVSASGGGGDAIEDHVALDSEDDDDLYVKSSSGAGASKAAEDDFIQPQVPPEVWKLEVEKVAPLLQYRTDDTRDWRARVESATTLLKAVEKMYPDIKLMLERMGDDISKATERIQKREQTLAQQFHEHVEDYRQKLRDLNAAQDALNAASQNVSGLTAELNHSSEQLEQIKAQIADREEKSSDITPLVRIKESVAKVRAEIKEMSLRIGILQHTTLHYTLRQQKAKRGAKDSAEQMEYYAELEQQLGIAPL